MRVLELFAGSRSIGNVCDDLGYNVFSSDINPFDNIDYVIDINKFDVSVVPFIPDFIWASPPCTYFSVASIGKHWNKNNTPKSDNALKGVEYVKSTLKIINYFKLLNPNLPREECFNGNKDCHHEAAPRGSRTGTQGLKGNYDRSKIPQQLCEDIVKANDRT